MSGDHDGLDKYGPRSVLADVFEYEIVLVNDYSQDQTWQIISDLALIFQVNYM